MVMAAYAQAYFWMSVTFHAFSLKVLITPQKPGFHRLKTYFREREPDQEMPPKLLGVLLKYVYFHLSLDLLIQGLEEQKSRY